MPDDDTPEAPPPRASRVPDADRDRDRDDRDDDYHPDGENAKYDDGNEITQNDTTWAVFAHIGVFVASFLAPLIILLAMGGKSPFVARHAKESLNHTITLALYTTLTLLVGTAVGFAVYYGVANQQIWPAYLFRSIVVLVGSLGLSVLNVVCVILATIAASKGKLYRYPLTVRLIG